MKAFHARVTERGKQGKQRREELFAEAIAEHPCEEVFARHIIRLWREAMWLEKTGNFANGKPLNEQFEPELRVIETFLAAVVRRENRLIKQGSEEAAPQEAPGPEDGRTWH